VQLDVLGAGPAYGNRPDSIGAAYLLRAGPGSLLLDLGQGAFARLASEIEPSTLGAVAISHLHPDHFIDLVPLRHYLRYEFEPPRRVPVIAPAGLADRLDALLAEPGFAEAALDFEEQRPGLRTIGRFELEATRVRHTADSYAMRLTEDGSEPAASGLVYSGDCGSPDDLMPIIRPGDDLLCEVSFGTGAVPAGAEHLNAPGVAELAARSGVRRLLLTHLQIGFDPEETLAAVSRVYSGPVRFVWPGDRLEL
jgi:ribonuclease BN (tRNA processing enzyme)